MLRGVKIRKVELSVEAQPQEKTPSGGEGSAGPGNVHWSPTSLKVIKIGAKVVSQDLRERRHQIVALRGCPFPPFLEVGSVAKPELGNKHHCQTCGTRFFDLNKSPIRCPKCGAVCQAAAMPRVAQHAAGSSLRAKSRFRPAAVADDEEPPAGAQPVLDSLDDADVGEDKFAVVADDDVEIEAGDETLLEEEEEDADDVVDLIDGEIGDEEER